MFSAFTPTDGFKQRDSRSDCQAEPFAIACEEDGCRAHFKIIYWVVITNPCVIKEELRLHIPLENRNAT